MEQQGDVCGAGSTEKVSSAPWDFSDCSAEVRSGGLTAHVRQRGSWKLRHQWSSLVFRWGGGRHSLSWKRGKDTGPIAGLSHNGEKLKYGQGLVPTLLPRPK